MKNHVDDSKKLLYAAKSRLAQSISELTTINDNEIRNWINKTQLAFNNCWNSFQCEYKILKPEIKDKDVILIVIRKDNKEYLLPCSICGGVAAGYIVAVSKYDNKEKLFYIGLTHKASFSKNLAEILFEALERENVAEVHEFMKKYHEYEGLDAYCPECDKIYCWEHYNVEEEWDEGFYDCTYTECPNGHRRMIDN